MSLLWIEGFEGFGTTVGNAPAPTNVMARKYTVSGESGFDIETGRIGGYCLEFNSNSHYIQRSFTNTHATIIVGFALKLSDVTAEAYSFLQLADEGGNNVGALRVVTDGELSFRVGSSLIDTTTGLNLVANVWYWIEVKVVIGDSGTYDIRVGETSVLSGTTDTKPSTYTACTSIKFAAKGSYLTKFDDIYICNGDGSVNNDFLGDMQVVAIYPDAAGTTTNFTPSAGDNYTCMDEAEVNDDADYVESATDDHKDTYSYGDIAAYTDIKGLQVNTMVRQTDATSMQVITVVRSNSTDYDDSAQAIGTTSYICKVRVVEVDPATTAAWLYTAINSAEFGIKLNVP